MDDAVEPARNEPASDVLVLDSAHAPQQCSLQIARGEAIAYTCRSPDKATDNEDTAALIPYGPNAAVLVIADGAGGLPAGRRASQTAIAALVASLETSMRQTMLLRTAILDGIDVANNTVREFGNGAATTFTVVTIEDGIVRFYQVGDSEAMLVGQRGRIKLQTTAHSPTGFAVEAGFLDQRAALHHEERHLVSNFLGSGDMRIDIGAETRMSVRDTLLLASDGLTDNVHVDEIIERIRKGPLGEAAASVIALAQHRMGADNTRQPSKPDDLSLILYRPNYRPKAARRVAGASTNDRQRP